MPKIEFTNRVLFTLIATLIVVIASAFLVNKSLQSIVQKIYDEAQPNTRLVELKSVLYTVTNAESQVKSYGITLDEDYLTRYNQSITHVDSIIKLLYREARGDDDFMHEVRSIDSLSDKKFEILDELLVVQNEQSVSSVLEKVQDKMGLVSEVTKPAQSEETKTKSNSNFLKKLFGNRESESQPTTKTTNNSRITYSYSTLNREISSLKEEETAYEANLKIRELDLIQSNQEIMDQISGIVQNIEKLEEDRMQVKLLEADNEGRFTRTLIALFCIISCILLILAGYTVSVYVKQNNAYKLDLNRSKNETERINKEIVASINYAKRLQTAILPDEEKIARLLPSSFILYKPKDIVAGDFYWMVEKEDYLFVAVVDCTGHGVPGAMVSMTCSSALNRSVKEFGLDRPADILDKCLQLIIETFDGGEYAVYDGMDISLCRIDKKKNKIQFAGANNHLFYISGGVPNEVRADNQSVSRFYSDSAFTNNEIDINPGDTFFLFTDGLQDQFGGPRRKKLMPHRVKKFLLENVNLPFPEQSVRLERAMLEWQGDLDQIDDVCVMGFQV